MKPEPTFFATPAEFRSWLEKHHAGATELVVGFHKKGSGRPSMTWPESVDEALSYGWIDGVGRRLDETSYTVRFTPRKARSIWSNRNIARVEELTRLGRMRPGGLAAFEARSEERSGVYSFEQERPARLAAAYERQLRADPLAWEHFRSQPPWYRKASIHWVMSAKKEETRLRRLASLIEHSAKGATVPPLSRRPASKRS